jgi:hypothetical protein
MHRAGTKIMPARALKGATSAVDRLAMQSEVEAFFLALLADAQPLVAGSRVQSYGGMGGRFASALARPPGCFALAVGIELLVGQHADQDDGSHHREVE